jgi:hypothetical protein
MNTTTAWHSDGLRRLAALLTDLAEFLDRTDSAPGGRAYVCPSEACDDARARSAYRFPYY